MQLCQTKKKIVHITPNMCFRLCVLGTFLGSSLISGFDLKI